jgi:hypothetical protein
LEKMVLTFIERANPMHNEIRNRRAKAKNLRIYSSTMARRILKRHLPLYHQISVWKQENIREAAHKKGCSSELLWRTVSSYCGYCIAFRNETDSYRAHICEKCPIYKKCKKPCYDLKLWDALRASLTSASFLRAHKKWCTKIGLGEAYRKRQKQ